MKKIDLSQIVNTIATLGVIVGIVFLVVELDQNSDLLRAQIHQSRSDSYEAFVVDSADSEFFLPAWEKFRAAGEPGDVAALDALTPIERARIERYFQGRLGGYDNLFFQFRSGYLDPDFYESRVVGSIRTYLPVYEELGLLRTGLVTQSFLDEIERIRSGD
jgi:hypothetical protein